MRYEPDAARVSTLRGLASFVVAAAVAVVVARVAPMSFGVEHALFTGLIFATAASAWGLFAGFGGQFSFGHAALFGLTPYGAVLAGQWWGVPPLIGVLATAALVAVMSLLIVGPSLRLRGPFFALVTLALAEIARQWVNEQRDVTGGEGGMLIDPTGTGLLHLEDLGARGYMAVAAVLLAVTLAVNWTLVRSRLGYQLTALRDDQDIAATTGIDTARTKVVTYLVSAFFTGLAGGVYAYSSGIVASDALLGPAISIAILIYAGVGGMRSVFGPAIGAMVLVAVEEALRVWVGSSAPSVYQIAFSTLFVIALFALPGGLVSLPSRLRDRSARTTSPGEPGDGTASAPLRDVSAAHIRDLLDDLHELERQGEGDERQQVDLRVESLRKAFGGLSVTRDVDLTVPAGASVGIWGHNGSGKSTLLNQVGGQLAPDAGHIWLGSRRVEDMPVHRRARLGIVRASQQATVYETHSVQDNLLATLYTTKTLNPLRERDHQRAIEFVGRAVTAVGLPTASLPKPAADLSTGQRKRLEIARLLVGYRPRVMLLDEPTAGIDRHGVGHMADILTALRTGTGATMIVVDHDEDFLTAATSTIVCLSHGRVIDTIDVSSDEVTERLGRAVVAGGAGA